MRNLNVRAIHSVPAFAFGCFAAAFFSLIASLLNPSPHGSIVPGSLFFVILVLPLAAIVFFPLFFFLRWVKFLNVTSLVGGIALVALLCTWPHSAASLLLTLQFMSICSLAAAVAFFILRGWALADARSNYSLKRTAARRHGVD